MIPAARRLLLVSSALVLAACLRAPDEETPPKGDDAVAVVARSVEVRVVDEIAGDAEEVVAESSDEPADATIEDDPAPDATDGE